MNKYFSQISHVHFLYDRFFAATAANHSALPINAGQMRLMLSLWQKDGISIRDLAESNCLKKSTLSTMLPRMIEEGLIELAINGNDARSRIITLTAYGKKLQDTHERFVGASTMELFSGTTDEEQKIFLKVLTHIKENLIKKESERHQ